MKTPRRQFLAAGMTFGVARFAATVPGALAEEPKEAGDEEDVSPAEDLMREHGLLKRILLVYGEAVRRIEADEDLPPTPVAGAGKIIRSFIEDYHEKLEEDFLFPRFKKANKLVDLTDVLLKQHQAGRRLTDTTLRLANDKDLKSPDKRKALAESLRLFVRMYAPHEAREDTVLFPAFHEIIAPTSTTHWAMISSGASTTCSARTVLMGWSAAWPRSKRAWASTTCRNSLLRYRSF